MSRVVESLAHATGFCCDCGTQVWGRSIRCRRCWDHYRSAFGSRCGRYWPTDLPTEVPFGTPLTALAAGIPFADLVTEVRLERGRIVFDYTEDD